MKDEVMTVHIVDELWWLKTRRIRFLIKYCDCTAQQEWAFIFYHTHQLKRISLQYIKTIILNRIYMTPSHRYSVLDGWNSSSNGDRIVHNIVNTLDIPGSQFFPDINSEVWDALRLPELKTLSTRLYGNKV